MFGRATSLDMAARVPFYKNVWQDAADVLQVDFHEVENDLWRVSSGDKRTLIHNYKVQIDDPVVLDLAGDKALCNRLLKENGLPVPDYRLLKTDNLDGAERFIQNHPDSLFVVKPARDTSGSRGVTTHIRSFRDCRSACALASLYCNELIIERLIIGESCRLLILDGKMIHATRRAGVRIVGDGTSTIHLLTLTEKKLRGFLGPDAVSDLEFLSTLHIQGLNEQSIPDAKQEVLVKCRNFSEQKYRELRTVFNEDITERVGGDLRRVAVQAAEVLNTKFAGIDIITKDPSVSLQESGGAIIEINTTPGLHHHYNLTNERSKPAVQVLRYLLRDAPSIAVQLKGHNSVEEKSHAR